MVSLLKKGNFQPINHQFMTEGRMDLLNLAEVQEKYKKGDIDNLLNELHDSMVGYYLGFQYVNIDKHGFDCKYDQDTGIFLESKVASFTASTWSATFNDTNMEKVQAFKEKSVAIIICLEKFRRFTVYLLWATSRDWRVFGGKSQIFFEWNWRSTQYSINFFDEVDSRIWI